MPENLYARTARFFVENRELSLLLVLASFAFGALSFALTPKQYNPEITLPAFRITTAYPGAAAAEVEARVTDQVENALAEIPGVDTISSQSFPGGTSVVSVIFEIGTDLDASKTAVIEKLGSDQDLAPLGVAPPLIQQIDPENVPVMTIAITSDTVSEDGLRLFALDLADELKTVPGVTALSITGGHVRELGVALDPDRMSARGVSLGAIEQAIRSNDTYLRAGSLAGQHSALPDTLDGTLKDAPSLGRIVVGGTPRAPIYLGDVAQVTDGYDTDEHRVSFAEKGASSTSAVYLSFAKTKGTNITDVTDAARERLAALSERFVPDMISLRIVRDEGETAGEEVAMLTEHLLFAIGIVTLTLVFFLGWRAALVVATAIPLTLALVFIVGYFWGATINRITLFALIFSLGLLVDDAIVVIENIYRHFAHKKEGKTDAIARATGEVGMGVLLSTITAVVVFVPMGLVTGMMGAYMGPIAFFAPLARLASLFVAYTLSPYAASLFLKEHVDSAGEHEKATWYETRYTTFIHKVLNEPRLQKRILAATLGLVVVAFSLPVLEFVHFRMLPKADKEQFYAYLDMPQGTALPATDAATRRLEEALLHDPSVAALETTVATPPVTDFNGLFRGSAARQAPHQATIKVDLIEKGTRPTSEEVVAALRLELAALFASEPDARLSLVEDPPGPPVLATLLLRIKGPDAQVRDDIARDMLARLHETPGVVDIDSSLPQGSELVLVVDHEKLSRSGLSATEVASVLRTALSGEAVAMAHLANKEDSSIVLRFKKEARDELSDLSRISLRAPSGAQVPLLSVVRQVPGDAVAPILHDDREAMAVVSGEITGRSVVYVVKDLILALRGYALPSGHGELVSWNLYGFSFRDSETGATYRLEWGGEFEMTLDNFRDLGLAMLVSYFLIYVILVAQFRSFRSPTLIMTTILLGFAGVLPGFALLDLIAGTYFSATSMIGVIALGGIVVGNAILLLDFIEQLRAKGQSTKHAIVEACRTRLRPIMLTSITAILGSVVIVADPVWSGLAWAIIFGLSLSTILTLVIFPVLYLRFGGHSDE